MTTHSSVIAWRIPGTGEPGGLPSMGSPESDANGDFSHEIKRRLLLGRKALISLASVLKSRGITLSTNVHLVKAMVFPVVMYGYEGWTIKEA